MKIQLENAQSELQKVEDVSDPIDEGKLQELRVRVERLLLTIQTLDEVVMGTIPNSAGCESQDFLENAKQ